MNSIFIKLKHYKDMHEMLDGFKFWPDLASHFGVTCPWAVKKNDVSNFSRSPLMRYLSNLQITKTGIKAWNEFKFGPDRIIHFGVIHPWVLIFFLIDLYWRKWCIHLFSITIQSPTNLQVTRIGIKSQTSLNCSQIWSIILELRVLVSGGKVVFIFNQIFFKLACN